MSYKYNYILKEWLKTKENLKIQSKQNYENKIKNYLADSIGNFDLNDLTYDHIKDFFNNLDKISISVKKSLIYIIKASLNYAYYKGYIKYIDLSNIKFKEKRNNIIVLSKQQQLILEKEIKNKINIRKLCLLLCFYTGLRVGEISGLKWSDIDFSHKSLTVKRTIIRIKNEENNSKTKLIESTPKSETSNRIIPIPDFIIDYLKKFKKHNNFFLLSDSIKLYDPRLIESFYKRILNKCEITYNKFHTIRHTFATRCIEAKMDIKTLSEILGHSKIETTLKLYVHPSYDLKRQAINDLVSYMES